LINSNLFGVAGEIVAILESLWFDLGELNCNKQLIFILLNFYL